MTAILILLLTARRISRLLQEEVHTRAVSLVNEHPIIQRLTRRAGVKFEKELEHTAGYATKNSVDPSVMSPLQGRGWIGLKAVFYTSSVYGIVKLEQWIEGGDNTEPLQNNWHKLLEFAHTSTNWAAPQNTCGGSLNQLITWGGPMVFFRRDNIDDVDIGDFSVKEITPPT